MNYTVQFITEYLNQKTGKEFYYEQLEKYLLKLINEGYNVNQFQAVIDKKVKQWKNTPYSVYLRPATLFGDKFKQYLNEQRVNNFQRLQNAVDKAKSFDWKMDNQRRRT